MGTFCMITCADCKKKVVPMSKIIELSSAGGEPEDYPLIFGFLNNHAGHNIIFINSNMTMETEVGKKLSEETQKYCDSLKDEEASIKKDRFYKNALKYAKESFKQRYSR